MPSIYIAPEEADGRSGKSAEVTPRMVYIQSYASALSIKLLFM